MTTPVDRVGQFRAIITDYGLTESKDGAVGVSLKAKLLEWFDLTQQDENGAQGAWLPWEQYDVEAEGVLWIIGKNEKGNKINELAATSLVAHAGWDGNLESITNGSWQPTKCQIAVTEDTYRDETRLRLAFVNSYDRNPLGMGSVAPEKARELQGRFGSQLRAVAGNAKRNAAPQNGSPPKPPGAAKSHAPSGEYVGSEIPLPPPPRSGKEEEIPF